MSGARESGGMTPLVPATPFPAGVASFDPTERSVIIWVALDGVDSCSWELAADELFGRIVASGVIDRAGGAPTVWVEVDGLEPGRSYWYRFTAPGATSDVGRTRTLPGGDPDRLRLGITCCARFGQSRFEVYRELAAADVDLVVHLGDYIYEDTKCEVPGREPEPDHDCVTLEDYRTRHLQCRRDPELRRLHQQHPMVVIWDDHDIADNAFRDGASNHDDDEQGPWAPRLAAALQAHHEFLPKRLAAPGDVTTPWRRLDAGSLVTLICTETRAHRDAPSGMTGADDASAPKRTMLGAPQRDWLAEAVADPGPCWALVLSGTVVSELTIDAPDDLGGALPEKYTVQDGRALNSDQWDGYLADRDVLVAAARRRRGGTVMLSGDIHSAWAIEGPSDEDGPVAVEFTCPPAATTPLGQLLPSGGGELLSRTVTEQMPHVRWMSGDHRGYLIVDLARDRIRVSYWWVEEAGDGEAVSVTQGRRWEVPNAPLPARLVDPEMDRAPEPDPPGRPGAGSRTLRAVGIAIAGLAVIASAVSALALMRRRGWWAAGRASRTLLDGARPRIE